jgi:hypothetical protein
MSNSEFDLDEALDIVAEARERKQKLRDALIEFAVSRGMVGDDYDGKHGEAGSRDQERNEEQAASSNGNTGGSGGFFDEPKESNGGDSEIPTEIDTDDVGKAAKVKMAMSLVEDDGMDTDEAKAMVGL